MAIAGEMAGNEKLTEMEIKKLEKKKRKKEKRKLAREEAAKNESKIESKTLKEDSKENSNQEDSSNEMKKMSKKDKKKNKRKLMKEQDVEMKEVKEEKEEKEEPEVTEKKKKKKKNKKKKNTSEEDSKDSKEDSNDSEDCQEPPKKKKKKSVDDKDSKTEESPKKKNKKTKSENPDDENSCELKNEKTGLFKKVFYEMSSETRTREFKSFFEQHSIAVYGNGSDKIRPLREFSELSSLDPKCLLCTKGFKNPTPIQSMTWPVAASGRDVIGIAETGSGKTLAFSLPALAHILERIENPVRGQTKGKPMMLVLAPTRELAMQSQVVLEAAGKSINIKSTCLYGGVQKYEQRKALKSGVEVVVATPGRLLDLIEEGNCDLSMVSYVVLDEADRMLDQGFERAIRAILGNTHQDRQMCLFSATWPDCIRELAHEFLNNPIKVTIGSEDLAAGKTVTQIVEVVEERSRDGKINGLLKKYHVNKNRILIFVLYKKEADRLLNTLVRSKWNCGSIHGNKSQEARIQAVEEFKSGRVPILIATDVAARGLDIPDVEYVLNYSFPLTIEDYVHRIGRTGRAGKKGTAHTFFHSGDKARAGELVNLLKEGGQEVPKEMYKFDLSVKRKEHKLYGAFGPKKYDDDTPMKKATKITFDE